MFCNKCGKEIPDGSEFCNFCGNRIQAAPVGKVHNPKRERTGASADPQIIVECNPHWFGALKFILIGIILFVLGVSVSPFFIVLAIVDLIVLFVWRKGRRLYLTADSVVGKIGIINTRKMMSALRNVQDVSVSNGLWGKLFGYANVTVSTAGTAGAEYVFHQMTNAPKFQEEFVRLSGGLR